MEGDSRSPCPAVNTLANHGYLPRDGKSITPALLIDALTRCYRLSQPLAWVLAYGGLLLLGQGSGPFELHDLARHNKIEHDASLFHPNIGPREEYAPIHGEARLLRAFLAMSADGRVITPEDLARVRVQREAETPLDPLHAEIARGEMAIVLNMFNNPDPTLHAAGVPLQPRISLFRLVRTLLHRPDTGASRPLDGVPIDRLRYWFEHERIPPGWEPYHETTLLDTVATSMRIRRAMKITREVGMGQTHKTKGAVQEELERMLQSQGDGAAMESGSNGQASSIEMRVLATRRAHERGMHG